MKTHIKYGLFAVLGWNALLFIAMLIRSQVKDVSVSYFFEDGVGGYAISALMVLWSIIWFSIGAHTRKDFIAKKHMYKEMFPQLEATSFDKEFRGYYFSKHAKMLAIVFATAIPWYVIGYVREPICFADFSVIAPLMLLSILCFWYYKKHKPA